MSRKLVVGIILFSLLIFLIAIGGMFSEKLIVTENKITIGSDKYAIQNYLKRPENWLQWMWLNEDPSMKTEVIGNIEGQDAGVRWKSEYAGKGALNLYEIQGDSVFKYEMISDDQQFKEKGVVSIRELSDSIQVVYAVEMDISGNIKARYLSYIKNYSSEFSFYQKEMIKKLKNVLENGESQK